MSIANVKCDWVDGDQVFSTLGGTKISSLNGDGTFDITELVAGSIETDSIALSTKEAFIADTADIADTVTVEKINAIIADINAIKDVFVTLGFMAAS